MAYSYYWLNEKYDGDLNNVPDLVRGPNGSWQGKPGVIYDINPETGQKGQFRWMGNSANVGWIDVTPPRYYTITRSDGSTFKVKMTRNRHGLYAPEQFLDENNNRIRFNTNPNTGEEGEWIWLGTMGWTNIKPTPQPEPEPGTLVFGAGGNLVGPYDPSENNNSSDNTGGNNDAGSGADQNNNPPPPKQPVGHYWASLAGSWQWIPVYEGDGILDGAVYVEGATAPSGPPAGYDANGPINTTGGNNSGADTGGTNNSGANTGGSSTPDNTGGGVNPPNNTDGGASTPPPSLYTPDASMFYQGMFTAQDLLGRDGGEITSTFYDNARQSVLDALAQQAANNGRTQNTAEEIQMAQGYRPTFSSGGLFDLSNANLMRNIGFDV